MTTYSIPEDLKNVNLQDLDLYFDVDSSKLDEKCIDRLRNNAYEFSEDDDIGLVWAPDIDRLDVPYDSVYWDSPFCDDEYRDEILHQMIKPANHYLVFASGCRWNGASGYSFKETPADCLYRSYDATIRPHAVSKGGKTLVCIESSHDVPMGSHTYIIALTDDEYRRLEDAEFSTVRKFAEAQASYTS